MVGAGGYSGWNVSKRSQCPVHFNPDARTSRLTKTSTTRSVVPLFASCSSLKPNA